MEDNWVKQTLKAKKATILPILSCKICNKLLDDATAIDECLHLFCRKCIYDKITEEDIDHCPICNVYLGAEPLNRLREDRSIKSLRLKFFPPTTDRQMKAHDDVAGSSKAVDLDVINTPKETARNDDDNDSKDQDISKKLEISDKLSDNISLQSIINLEGTKNDAETQEVNQLLSDEPLNDAVKDASDVQNLKKSKKKKMGRMSNADKDEEKKISTTNMQEYDDDALGCMKIKDIIAEAKLRKKQKGGDTGIIIRTNVESSNNVESESIKANDTVLKVKVSEEKKENVQNVMESTNEGMKQSQGTEIDEKAVKYLASLFESNLKTECKAGQKKEPISEESSKLTQHVQGSRCSIAPTSKKIYKNKGKNANRLKGPQIPDEETKPGKGK